MNSPEPDARSAAAARRLGQARLRTTTAAVGVAGLVGAGVIAFALPGSAHHTSTTTASGGSSGTSSSSGSAGSSSNAGSSGTQGSGISSAQGSGSQTTSGGS